MNSLQKLLAEESFQHSNFIKTKKQLNVAEDNEQVIHRFICHNRKSLNHHRDNKSFTEKGSSVISSERFNSASESGDITIDESAVKALIAILSGYIGRYGKDSTFRGMIRNKCRDCLDTKKKDFDDSDDRVFAEFESGIECIEKFVEDSDSKKELRSLKNSVQLFSFVANLNSKKSKKALACGVLISHISACAHLYLSVVYKLQKNDRISARYLLRVFEDSPFLARTHLLPDLWEHLFLPHLLHLKIWHHNEISIPNKSLNALNKAYDGSLDIGTIQFALYYKEWLKIGGKVPPVPHIPLPSKPGFVPSRRISSDSFTSSRSSTDRNLYLAVFGPTPENHSIDFDKPKRDFWIQEDGYKSVNYVADKARRSHRRSSSQDYTSSRKGSKSVDYFGLFSCQSVVSECLIKGKIVRSKNYDLPLSDLARAIHTISSSDNITDCEISIRLIAKAWIDSNGNPLIENALSKAPVLEGILEVLFASYDEEVLELGISFLAEFVSRNEANRLVVLNADPQLEIFERLLRSSSMFLKAAVLLYKLKPKAKQMISIEWVALALRVLEFGDQCMPQKAAMYLLDQLLTGFNEDRNLENASHAVSLGGLSLLLMVLEKGDIEERSNAVMLMCCCVQASRNCGKYLVENVNKTSILELVGLGIKRKSTNFVFDFLTELLCINRRTHITKFLIELNQGWSGLSTMHIFLVYLQRALPEERPLVAAILLQLDLLGDPFKSSLYREDAIEVIIESLDSGISNSRIQEELARALSTLGGHFSQSEDLFLQESNEEEKEMEDWRRKAAIVLLNTGSKRFLDALSNAIANGIPNLAQSCLFTVSWMKRVLLSADDEISRSLVCSPLLKQRPEFGNFDRTLDPRLLPFDSLQHLIKNAECMTMLATMDKGLIDHFRNP